MPDPLDVIGAARTTRRATDLQPTTEDLLLDAAALSSGISAPLDPIETDANILLQAADPSS